MRELKRRKSWVASFASSSSRLIFYSGLEAKEIKERELKTNEAEVSELKGRTVGTMPGIVRGRARVCQGIAEARRKIKKGDILVTNMTTPDFLPILKIVKGIVTKEGGITCHAAIISRELQIPCIVGARLAMEAIRDQGYIEINTKEGIIKLLKKDDSIE